MDCHHGLWKVRPMSFPSIFTTLAMTNFCIGYNGTLRLGITLVVFSHDHNQIITPPNVRLFAPPCL